MLRERLVLANATFNLVAIPAMFWLIYLNLSRFPPQIPLFYIYNSPSDILTPIDNLWLLPAIATASFFINLGLGKLIYKRDPLLTKLILITSSLLSLLLTLEPLQILRAVLY